MRWRVLAVVPVVLAVTAVAAEAQRFTPPDRRPLPSGVDRRRPAAEGADPAGRRLVEVSLGVGSWWWFSHFRADTLTDRFEITGPTTFDSRLAVSFNVWKQLEIELAPEFAMGDGTTTWVVGLGAALRLDLFDEMGPFLDGVLRPRVGLVAGGFDWDKAPGSFDTGFGAELGAEFACRFSWLPRGLSLTAGLDLRSMTFKFDPDPDVQDADSAYGGFGLLVRFGARYAF